MPYFNPIYRDPMSLLNLVRESALGGPGPVQLRGANPNAIQPVPMPQLPQRPGILERLFPTPPEYAGLLSPDAIQSARKNQLLQLGVGLLANSGPRVRGTPGSGFGERIGAALQQMPNWNEMLANLAQQRQALMGQAGAVKTVDAGDRILFYDQAGNVVGERAKGAAPGQGAEPNLRPAMNPQTGKLELYRIDPRSGAFQSTGLEVPQNSGVTINLPSESERRGAALLTVAEDAFGHLKDAKAPSAAEGVAGALPFGVGQPALSAERQQQVQAGMQLIRSYTYLVSGASMSEREARDAAMTFLPQFGDSQELLDRKARARESIMRAIRQAAGRAASAPDATGPSQAPTPQPGSPRPPLNFRVPQ